jgi:copper chaperone CopZ
MCGGCAAVIEKIFQAKGWIATMEVDVGDGRVIVSYDSIKIRSDEIAGTIAGLGYRNKVFLQRGI